MAEQSIPQADSHEAAETKKMSAGRIVIWLVVALIVLFVALGLRNRFSTQPTEGGAPDFTLTTYDGSETYTLSELEGQVVVVNFWASWCVPCADEAPNLERAYQNYRNQDVVFLGVAYVDSEEKALEFIDRYGVTYPNGPDLRSRISDAYNIIGVPETFVIDRNGEIVEFYMEPLTYDRLAGSIEEALARQ